MPCWTAATRSERSSCIPDPEEADMNPRYAPNLSHFGLYCRDIDAMTAFYRAVFDLV